MMILQYFQRFWPGSVTTPWLTVIVTVTMTWPASNDQKWLIQKVSGFSRDGHGHVHGRSRCGNGAQSKTLEILYKTKRSSRKNKNFSLWYHLWIIFRLSTDWLRFSSKFSKLGDNPLINHMITDRYGSIDLTLYHVTNIEKGFQNFFYRTIKIKFFY